MNDLPKEEGLPKEESKPLELIAPVPIEWEIDPHFKNAQVDCWPTGEMNCRCSRC